MAVIRAYLVTLLSFTVCLKWKAVEVFLFSKLAGTMRNLALVENALVQRQKVTNVIYSIQVIETLCLKKGAGQHSLYAIIKFMAATINALLGETLRMML